MNNLLVYYFTYKFLQLTFSSWTLRLRNKDEYQISSTGASFEVGGKGPKSHKCRSKKDAAFTCRASSATQDPRPTGC